jgi:hypothetical protein
MSRPVIEARAQKIFEAPKSRVCGIGDVNVRDEPSFHHFNVADSRIDLQWSRLETFSMRFIFLLIFLTSPLSHAMIAVGSNSSPGVPATSVQSRVGNVPQSAPIRSRNQATESFFNPEPPASVSFEDEHNGLMNPRFTWRTLVSVLGGLVLPLGIAYLLWRKKTLGDFPVLFAMGLAFVSLISYIYVLGWVGAPVVSGKHFHDGPALIFPIMYPLKFLIPAYWISMLGLFQILKRIQKTRNVSRPDHIQQ